MAQGVEIGRYQQKELEVNVCQEICADIESVFGHRVDPTELAKLIESSPLPK